MQADADEAAWNAGSEGERRVAACLAERLSDAWVMVGGYRNGKGEIDRVLIGPRGIAAIEVKHLRGAIHCAGGRWWRDRYDRYGNLVAAAEPIADKGGRGPDRQLKEPADALQAHLARNGIDGRVLRLVVFSHEASWIGRLEGLEADAAATLAALDLEPLLARSTLRLDAAGVERAVVALRCDHDYHERRRARGRAACVQ
ncbi:MAG: hypothetical protein POELPBGB_01999 [Bacteroidia bacterium]|nr:hypothetical protein [Bacteroidia bacterium]